MRVTGNGRGDVLFRLQACVSCDASRKVDGVYFVGATCKAQLLQPYRSFVS